MYTMYIELDECTDPSLNDCDVNANCTDIPGSYMCDCVLGYEGNGTFCESMIECLSHFVFISMYYHSLYSDVDECKNVTLNNCNENADCLDSEGSFRCTCREGYAGSGVDCQGKCYTI